MKINDKSLFKYYKIILLLSPILIFNNCGTISEPEPELQEQIPFNFNTDSFSVDEIYELIYGKWNWTHSIIMQRSIQPPDDKITPVTVGYSMQIEFKRINLVYNYRNNMFVDSQTYEINRYKVLETDSQKVTVIKFDDIPYRLYFFNHDMMMFGNGGLDGVDKFYVRIK